MPDQRSCDLEPGDAWLGAHFFFDADDIYSEPCDLIVLDVVAPLVATLDHRWFFLRYGEGGPHVRLRIGAPAACLIDEIRPAIEHAAAASPRVRRLEMVPYDPEVERYGGPDGVALAEVRFHQSSRVAVDLLRKSDAARSARLGQALLAMLVEWHGVADGRDAVAELAEDYGTSYLRTQIPDPRYRRQWLAAFEEGFERQADQLAAYVETAWASLEDGEPLTAELDVYREQLRVTTDRLRELCQAGRLAIDGATCRDWSMITRRLGIRDECYLAVLVHRALSAPHLAGRPGT